MRDMSLRLDAVEPETKSTIKRLQKLCHDAGLKLSSYKQSAMVGWNYEQKIQFDGWHGTGKWGKTKLLLTLYPNKDVSDNFQLAETHLIDFDRAGYGYFPDEAAKQAYLKNLEKAIEIVEKKLKEMG